MSSAQAVEWWQVSALASWLHRQSLLGLTNDSRPSEFARRRPVSQVRSALSPTKAREANRQRPRVERETFPLVDSIFFASVSRSHKWPQPAVDDGFLNPLRLETRSTPSVWPLARPSPCL